jgi:hypothetical protein
MSEYLNIIGFFSGQKCRELLYLRAVPPTGSHSDIQIIPGSFFCLMITTESGKKSTTSNFKTQLLLGQLKRLIEHRRINLYF